MAFPTDPTDLDIEMNLAGTWTNLRTGGFILDRGITITRGRSDETSNADPSKLSMTLNNVDGRFSPRNPTGPYFGLLGRNTPLRASVARGSTFLATAGGAGDKVTTPDAASLDITGDIDIRVDLTTDAWGATNLCGKWKRTASQLSWVFQVSGDGYLGLTWTTDGSTSTPVFAGSTATVPLLPGRLALRATLDVNNGASGYTATFYTAATISGTWVQLGNPVIVSGTTSIFSSTSPLELGDVPDQQTIVPIASLAPPATPISGRINAFELRNGIGGTVVANPVFTSQTIGATSFTDTAAVPKTWTLAGNTSITNRRFRFYGELSSLPPRWDVSGKDVYVPVEASGITRRLSQGASPIHSPIRRAVSNEAGLVAYWPAEDSDGATSVAAALPGVQSMQVTGTPTFATSDLFAGSDPLPTLGTSKWNGLVPAYTVGTTAQVRLLASVPSGAANNIVIASIFTTGTAARWEFVYQTANGGQIIGNVYDGDGTLLGTTGSPPVIAANGDTLRLTLDLTQSGSNIASVFWAQVTDAHNGASGFNLALTGATFGRVSRVVIAPNSDGGSITCGHVSVHNAIGDVLDLTDELNGFIGETAATRFGRLCDEESITYRVVGSYQGSEQMGVQKSAALLDLLQECVDADMGIMYEPRDALGLAFRTRNSLYNQPVWVTLDYTGDQVSGALEPTDDDQQIRNDVTVSRDNGGSFRVEATTGPLSTSAPPNGVGRYDTSESVNVYSDDQLEDQAGWRVHVGTVDEARYPTIGVDYTSAGVVGNAALNEALLTIDVGDRMVVTHPPAWLPPDNISQIVQGTSESYGNFQQSQAFNCSPESPYEVAVLDDPVIGRMDTDGSDLHTSVSSTAVTLSVDINAGPLWTTSAGDFPFDIAMGGEIMTVTAISGTASPQTFTVVRSVNGVVKAQTAGTDVRLAHPSIEAL